MWEKNNTLGSKRSSWVGEEIEHPAVRTSHLEACSGALTPAQRSQSPALASMRLAVMWWGKRTVLNSSLPLSCGTVAADGPASITLNYGDSAMWNTSGVRCIMLRHWGTSSRSRLCQKPVSLGSHERTVPANCSGCRIRQYVGVDDGGEGVTSGSTCCRTANTTVQHPPGHIGLPVHTDLEL